MTALGDPVIISGPAGRTLYDIAQVIESAQEAEQRVLRVLELLGRLVPYEHCALLLAHPVGRISFAMVPDQGDQEQPAVRAALERLLNLLDERAPGDAADLWPVTATPLPWQSHLAVPLIGLDHVLGVLAVGRESLEGYNDENLSLLSVVASQLGAYLTALLARESELGETEATAKVFEARARQQAVVAELGQRALAGSDLQVLMDEVVARVAPCLGVEYVDVLELLPDGTSLLLRAGTGWRAGLVGQATVGAGTESQAGFTLRSSEPVIVEDLRTEARFSGSPLLHEGGVVSGLSFRISSRERPFGVLGAYATRRQTFTPHDASFLQAVANILATVIERKLGEERERLLAQVSDVLAGSIDYQATLTSVAHLAVPYLADWCAVDSGAKDGSVQRLAVAYADPARMRLAEELQHHHPSGANTDFGVPEVLHTGRPKLYPEITDAILEAVAHDGDHLRTLRALGLASAMVVPLVARGRTLGVISFVTAESGRRYDASDLNLVQEIARRAALAIDNARLHADLQSQMEVHLRLNTDLRRLAEEWDALRRVAEERVAALEQLDRLKEDIIMTASHDLKSPITSIRGYAQLLRRRLRVPTPDFEQVAQGLEVIDRQATAMTHLLDDLLEAARIQAGAFALRTAPCDLGQCLDTVLARLNPGERTRVEVRLPDAPLAGDWEQKRIEQVLANLVGNALKYSPESEPVRVTVERHAGAIEVAVSDRGMGIPPEELPRLFERFHRTPQARASGLSGTGLGLYISRGIVEAHGGRIWATSPGEGQGTTFRYTLPIEPLGPGAV